MHVEWDALDGDVPEVGRDRGEVDRVGALAARPRAPGHVFLREASSHDRGILGLLLKERSLGGYFDGFSLDVATRWGTSSGRERIIL